MKTMNIFRQEHWHFSMENSVVFALSILKDNSLSGVDVRVSREQCQYVFDKSSVA